VKDKILNLTHAIISGRCSKDPELKYTEKGTPVLTFSIAVNKPYKKPSGEWKNAVSFFEIVTFGAYAENIKNRLKKGFGVFVSGELVEQRWSTNEGQNKSKIKITAKNIQVLSRDESAEQESSEPSEPNEDEEIPF